MGYIRLLILIMLIISVECCFAQQETTVSIPENLNVRSLNIGDSSFMLIGNCKNVAFIFFTKEKYEQIKSQPQIVIAEIEKVKSPLFTIHGNILYNFNYRSYIDTPFAESNVMQHLVQTNFNLLIKDKYPVKVIVSNRSSNSPYFKNATDVKLEFNRYQLLDNIKADLRKKTFSMVNIENLTKVELLYKAKLNQAQALQSWLNNPARAQELVEEKERQLRGEIPSVPQQQDIVDFGEKQLSEQTGLSGLNNIAGLRGTKGLQQGLWNKVTKKQDALKAKAIHAADSVKALLPDTIKSFAKDKVDKIKDSSLLEKFNAKKQQLAKLQAELKQDEAKAIKAKKAVEDSVNKVKQEINSLNTGTGLYAFMKRHGLSKSQLTKGQRVLLSINKIGIGRNWVDYSELTVKNVSLTGVNIEMNPSPFYVAFAAGKLNYRFRDFILKENKTLPNQSLWLVRAGVGQKEKSNLIFTFYNGKKAVLNYSGTGDPATVQRVLGISAEGRFAINENNYVVAEVAKSSYGNNTNPQPSQSALLNKATNLKIHTNQAYSIKLFSLHPQTDTKITAYYRKMGENFQSFNLYPIGNNQEAWMARVNQSFWKRKLTLDVAIRKNDFINPTAAPSFASKTVFKSFQATLRVPKYPFVSLGYYPSSQLSLSNNNLLTENQYNTFNAIVSHSYRLKTISMNTNAVYTKFYNSSSDSGFIYFNAASWTVNHSIFLSAFTLQTSAGLTQQKDLHLFTLEQLLSYQFKNSLTLSGGLKWNKLNRTENLFGATAAMSVYIKKMGTFQFNYDKTYLPGYDRLLIPVDVGRMSFYREF